MEKASDITAVNTKCIAILILLCFMVGENYFVARLQTSVLSFSIGPWSVTSQSIRRSTEYHIAYYSITKHKVKNK